MVLRWVFILSSYFYFTQTIFAQQPVELGDVQWLRQFEQAQQVSANTGKSIFILFQEVPGCSTCQRYGQQVLQHPLIVEAIETYFVPLAIYNNKRGADAKVLKRYKEPAWNNPVVRIVNAQGQNIIERVSGNYTPLRVVQAINQAIDLSGTVQPEWLRLLEQELQANLLGTETADFAMYCFWTGEKQLGQIDGVVETQAGFMGGREVVEVTYDPSVVSFDELLGVAQQHQCASQVFTTTAEQQATATAELGSQKVQSRRNFRADHQPKYFLQHSSLKYVPMTGLQASRVNAALGARVAFAKYLSPRQLQIAQYIQQHPTMKWESAIDTPLEKHWGERWEVVSRER
ncbi:MAG: VPGUxxT family thioredoxin-like (seleno)protein, type 2 [Bacteroidota bacterium]